MLPHFNSIKVRLKQSLFGLVCTFKIYFNSIKVRLKPLMNVLKFSDMNSFQFHKGTIKTEKKQGDGERLSHFNSIKVRLKLTIRLIAERAAKFQFYKGTIKTRFWSQCTAKK